MKFLLESRADGEGKLARRCNIKSASFHARSDSEIYTTEYSIEFREWSLVERQLDQNFLWGMRGHLVIWMGIFEGDLLS